MPTASGVADWLVKHRADDAGVPIDAMSLEKHLFYAQGFFLATRGRPLFADEIRAWRDGPVVPDVWRRYAKHGGRPILKSAGAPPPLADDVENFLSDIVRFLSPYPAIQLSGATHAEDPWKTARAPFGRHDASDVPISQEVIASYFTALISEGEESLSQHAVLDMVPEPRWGWLYVAGICSRAMRAHPFFILGTSMWNARLWETPEAPAYSDELYRPPTLSEAMEFYEFTSAEEYQQLRQRHAKRAQ